MKKCYTVIKVLLKNICKTTGEMLVTLSGKNRI